RRKWRGSQQGAEGEAEAGAGDGQGNDQQIGSIEHACLVSVGRVRVRQGARAASASATMPEVSTVGNTWPLPCLPRKTTYKGTPTAPWACRKAVICGSTLVQSPFM